jgi:very-short-patch-repair endonuclease
LLLAKAKLPEPVAQHAVVFERFTLHPDLAYPEIGLAIELDAFDYHGRTEEQFDDDKERDAFLTMRGWRVERFSPKTMHLLVPVVRTLLGRKTAS